MADRVTIDDAALDRLFRSTAGPVAKELKRLGVRVNRRAKQLAPVDTGRLRSSIVNETQLDERGLVEIVGTDVEYAGHVELGTSRMAAQPYLRPALDAVRGGR